MTKIRMWEGTMTSKNHWEEGKQGSNKDNIDEVHPRGKHIKLEENDKNEDIAIKKIDAT